MAEHFIRRVKRQTPDEVSSPLWMTTYSDMVTLLLTFFILLFAMSVINMERFQKVIMSFQTAFFGNTGILDSPPEPETTETEMTEYDESLILEESLLEKIRQAEIVRDRLELFMVEAGLQGSVDIRLEERGVVMELPDYIFFERSSADLKPQSRHVLTKLAEFFNEITNQVIIEGHTCNLPINTFQYPSNWELSVARSVRVTRYLVEDLGLPPGRFIATGYGEYQPLDTNETAEGRARNRRVTVVISIN